MKHFRLLILLFLLQMWFKKSDAQPAANTSDVFYEIFVRSFYDSNGDSIGDLKGITQKLGYLADLGITGLWITPFNPSPSYHKYDITNYYDVDPEYGTLDDFKNLVSEAHKRNIKVLMDLVVNHTSVKHPWFLAAMQNDPQYHDYYIWSSDPKEGSHHNWFMPPVHPATSSADSEKYFGFFSRNMPDLNYDNPKVREEIIAIGKWWITNTGLDGFRLDAAQHIYDQDEPEKNNQWWLQFTDSLKKIKPDVITIGEVWNKKDRVAMYLKSLTGAFNFELSWNILKALRDEKNDSLVQNLLQTYTIYSEYSSTYLDPIFLSNHDENRIQSDLRDSVAKAKLAACIYLTLPGTPFIYYGEEIGMRGKKPDQFIREPFLWDVKDKDKGQTHWEKAKFSTDSTIKPLSRQMKETSSMYNHYKRLIQLRRNIPALTSPDFSATTILDRETLSYYRGAGKNRIIVVHNMTGKKKLVTVPDGMEFNSIVYQSSNRSSYANGSLLLQPFSTVILGQK